MAKVDWISWRTDPSEIVNPERIDKKISEAFQNYHSYMKTFVSEEIRNDILVGGLSRESYSVSGSFPLYDKACEILDKIEKIDSSIYSFRENIMRCLEEEKKIEKDELIQAISLKIFEDEEILKKAKDGFVVDSDLLSVGMSRDDFIFSLDERIHKLYEKLDEAKSL